MRLRSRNQHNSRREPPRACTAALGMYGSAVRLHPPARSTSSWPPPCCTSSPCRLSPRCAAPCAHAALQENSKRAWRQLQPVKPLQTSVYTYHNGCWRQRRPVSSYRHTCEEVCAYDPPRRTSTAPGVDGGTATHRAAMTVWKGIAPSSSGAPVQEAGEGGLELDAG